jgi:thymidylate synthase ThyX
MNLNTLMVITLMIRLDYNRGFFIQLKLKVLYKILTIALTGLTKYFLNAGVAPEQARMVLPQSTMTEWYWSGSLDALADMCNLRCTGDTQLETRLVANQICDKMRELFPVSWIALRGL